MPLPKSVLTRIKQLAKSAQDQELALERASLLSDSLPTDFYSPSALARLTLLSPPAQRGFSESLVSTRPPIAAVRMRPSEFLEHTHH